MRIVVTGRQGQVVTSLLERASNHPAMEVVALGRPELDLTDPASIRSAIAAARPDVVVSAAAYTAVDQAEDEPELAHLINERGAGEVASAAHIAGAPVIHLSTDYVFSGDHDRPYTETMETDPRSVYGHSKLGGERAVAAANPNHVILRTAWVYSPFGKNFVKTMLKLAETRDHLNVVSDQHGNPTSALDIADAIFAIIARWQSGGKRPTGIYHFAGTGEASWCDFARHIFTMSSKHGGPFAEVAGITAQEYPTRAARPRNSRLDCRRFAADFSHEPPSWRQSTDEIVHRLVAGAIGDLK